MNYIRFVTYVILIMFCAACAIEGGVPSTPQGGAFSPNMSQTTTLSTSGAQPQSAGFRVGLLEEPTDLLPYHADATDQRITSRVSEVLFPNPLLSFDYTYTTTGVLEQVPSFENGDIELRSADVYLDATGMITVTATDVITQRQQLIVTYHWNPKLRWSDGVALTADDSVFAYELAKKLSLGEEANGRLQLLERYEKVDEHTTRSFLKPDYSDPAYIHTFWTPLPRHLLQDIQQQDFFKSAYAAQPIGYGPYKITTREQGNVQMDRNSYYFGSQPQAQALTFVFYPDADLLRSSIMAGSIDVAVADHVTKEQLAFLSRDQENGLIDITYTPSPIWEHLDFNLDVPLLQDIRIRRAISYGIDRQGMIDTLFAGHSTVLDSWILPKQWAAASTDELTRYPYDPDRARVLLDEVGILDNDGDGKREWNGAPLDIELLTTEGSSLRLSIAERLKADMAAIGITINLRPLPAKDLYNPEGPLFRRQFQLAQFAWIANTDPRGWELWSCNAVPNQANNWTGNNFPGWCFFEADQAIRTATTSLDQDERKAAYLRQQQLFSQELPVLPLFQRLSLTISNPSLQGLQPDPITPLSWNIATWSRGE